MAGFYETDRAVAEYLLFHYGDPDLAMPWPQGPLDALKFPERCVWEIFDAKSSRVDRALDLGCAVGRASFELARWCSEVIGIDASNRFIETARRLQETGEIEFEALQEGELTVRAVARVPGEIDRSRV